MCSVDKTIIINIQSKKYFSKYIEYPVKIIARHFLITKVPVPVYLAGSFSIFRMVVPLHRQFSSTFLEHDDANGKEEMKNKEALIINRI